MNQELLEKCKNADLLKEVAKGKEVVWINENLEKTEDAMAKINITMADIDDAEARLARFAPFLMKKFPETIPTNGLIESPLTYIPNMQKKLEEHYDTKIPGKMFLKQDSHLAISGSVKARHRFIYHCGVSAASVYREGWLHALQQACVSH